MKKGVQRKRDGQRPGVMEWINTICNLVLALAAIITVVYLILNIR
jgi:hypothetical protein